MAADRGPKVQVIRSILPYQILLYLNGFYTVLFTVAELLMYVYKGERLPMPGENLATEVAIVFLLAGIDAIRIYFAKKGNLTESARPVALSLLLALPSILGSVFLLAWQTYVLRAELILVSVQLTFLGLELLLGLVAIILFSRAAPY